MGGETVQAPRIWALSARQHGVVARWHLLALGLNARGIEHRLARGRLHRLWRGVYAVGRPDVSMHGRLMAAVLACGPNAVASHRSAGWLYGLGPMLPARVEVSVPTNCAPRKSGISVHRRVLYEDDVTTHAGIPVTTPICTIIDLATCLGVDRLERVVNEADRLGLTDPEELRTAVESATRRPGAAVVGRLLDRHTFTLTDSQLERRFLPIARRAGLSRPKTGCMVNGFEVDFYWPELGLVIETDGLRYHRTPAQQARDRLRDQTHAAAGLATLRFTHAQVAFDRDHVEETLAAVARRLERRMQR